MKNREPLNVTFKQFDLYIDDERERIDGPARLECKPFIRNSDPTGEGFVIPVLIARTYRLFVSDVLRISTTVYEHTNYEQEPFSVARTKSGRVQIRFARQYAAFH